MHKVEDQHTAVWVGLLQEVCYIACCTDSHAATNGDRVWAVIDETVELGSRTLHSPVSHPKQ